MVTRISVGRMYHSVPGFPFVIRLRFVGVDSKLMSHVRILICTPLLLVCLIISGCRSADTQMPARDACRCDSLDDVRLQKVKIGMSLVELREAQQQTSKVFPSAWFLPIRHHFTIQLQDQRVEAMSGFVVPGMPFVFLFCDDRLTAIIDPSVQTVNALENVTDPVQMASELKAHHQLDERSFRDAVRTRCQAWASYESSMEPLPFASLWNEILGTRNKHDAYVQLIERFDATKIQVGAAPSQVDAAFGAPAWVSESTDPQMLRIYGVDHDIQPYPNPRIFASFRDGYLSELVTRYNVPLQPVVVNHTYD